MTDRRVSLSLTFASEVQADYVLRSVLESLPDEQSAVLESASVHVFDLSTPDPEEPVVYLVIAEDIVQAAVTDIDAAESAASACQGVIATAPLSVSFAPADAEEATTDE